MNKSCKNTLFFATFGCFFSMKFTFRTILLSCLTFGLLVSASCRKHRGPDDPIPELKIDSLFVNLRQAAVEKRADMAEKAFSKIHKEQGLNGVVLYAEGGQVIYKKAFGWKNLAKKKNPLDIDDQFQLASVSKMFTAEAIMLLHAQGKLDYDDDITKYLPEFPYRGITVKELLTHRSGLSRYETLADEHWPDRKVHITNRDIIRLYRQYQPKPYYQPDTRFHYTNVNYALLASIVESISGMRFDEFMATQIFAPLNMTRSYILYSGNTAVDTYVDTEVQGYNLLKKGARRVQDDYLNGVVGDKMMYSTVDDLYRFHLALEYNLLLPDSIQQEAFKPGSREWTKGENYGFGWRMNKKHPGTVYHFGWWKGHRSFFIRDLEKGRVLIVLTNTSSSAVSEPLWEFINDVSIQLPKASVNKNLILN